MRPVDDVDAARTELSPQKQALLARRLRGRDVHSGEERELPVSALFIFIGAAPRTEMLAGVIERDDKGFVLTGLDHGQPGGKPKGWTLERDPFMFETNVPGVFAAGDVRSGANRRVAAAVGEGSAAIYTVHRYLETV